MTAGIWQEYLATQPHQQFSCRKGRGRLTQSDLVLEKPREAHGQSKALELPAIMALGIAQHGARLKELRDRGFLIENEQDRDSDGVVRPRYWLRFDPEREIPHGK